MGIVFRSEIAILLGTHTIWATYWRRLPIKSTITSGFMGVVAGLALTITVDSFFWQRFPMWPELVGFIYNVMNGQAANWGTSPFHFYFTSALPRLLYNPVTYILCIPLAVVGPLRSKSLSILIPNILFIAVYSLQPHKEWRFIVYSIPPITAVAAQGANWIWIRRQKSLLYRLLSIVLILSTLGAIASSLLASIISSLNYPGAAALKRLHERVDGSQPTVHVHMDTLSCMTGITRFLQIPPVDNLDGLNNNTLWLYDKTESEEKLLHPAFWDKFNYALAERPEKAIGAWEILETVDGYAGIGIVKPNEELRWPLPAHSDSNTKGRREGPWETLGRRTGLIFRYIAGLARKYVTRGWWVQVKMEPKVHILKRASML